MIFKEYLTNYSKYNYITVFHVRKQVQKDEVDILKK